MAPVILSRIGRNLGVTQAFDHVVREKGGETMSESGKPVPVGKIARDLIRGAHTAALATLGRRDPAGAGSPYASLVLSACTQAGEPLLLLSRLAEHTQNLLADPRASLLFDGTAGLDSPLTGARLSLQGRLVACGAEETEPRRRFLHRHPDAARYADFGDFGFYRLEPTAGHLVAGFGVIHWLPWTDIGFDMAGHEAVAEAEDSVLSHMNEDHVDAMAAIARGQSWPEGAWRMVGCDPEGFDLRAGGNLRRLDFDSPVKTADEIRGALVKLVRAMRETGAAARG